MNPSVNFLPHSRPEPSGQIQYPSTYQKNLNNFSVEYQIKNLALELIMKKIKTIGTIPDIQIQMNIIVGCAFGFGLKDHLSSSFVFETMEKISKEIYGEIAGILKSTINTTPIDFKEIYKTIDLVTSSKDDTRGYSARTSFTQNFAWAIPSQEAIESIVKFAGSEQILEIGSGLGLWAGLIRAHGGSIIPVDTFESHGTSRSATFVLTEEIGGITAIYKYKPKVLMMCWPSYGDSFAALALEEFETCAPPDAQLIYIGEGFGGCTGDDRFFEMLNQSWELVNQIDIPQWWGIYDCLNLYRRKVHEEPWITVGSKKSKVKSKR